MTRLRVLIVSHLALPHVGGVENLLDLEIRGLVQAGHQVTLLTSDGRGDGREPRYSAQVQMIRIPAWHWLERRFGVPYPLFSPTIVTTLWHLIAEHDIVHAHGFLFQNTAIAVWLAKLQNKDCLLTDHGGIQQFGSKLVTFLARLGVETVGRLSCLCATRVVTYNSRIQQQLDRLGRRRDTEFLANPVDHMLFQPPTQAEREAARHRLGWDVSRKKVLFVGRLLPTKGASLLLGCGDWHYDLVFCGPGDVSKLGPQPLSDVEFLPPRPQADLVELYHAADVLVLPTGVREGFPLVVQEALMCGLPVVLGYDPGFEPYRQLPGLTFCDRTQESVKAVIVAALTNGRVEDVTRVHELFLPLDAWIRRLFPLPDGTTP